MIRNNIILPQNTNLGPTLLMGEFRNNERGELEDQIAKYSKEMFHVENENKSLLAENTKLKKEIEKNASHQRGSTNSGNEIITDPNGNQEGSENADDVERRWEEIISELEERIEVRTWVEYLFCKNSKKL